MSDLKTVPLATAMPRKSFYVEDLLYWMGPREKAEEHI